VLILILILGGLALAIAISIAVSSPLSTALIPSPLVYIELVKAYTV
jgi:hypothetical protein